MATNNEKNLQDYVSLLETKLIQLHDFVLKTIHEVSSHQQSNISTKLEDHFRKVVELQQIELNKKRREYLGQELDSEEEKISPPPRTYKKRKTASPVTYEEEIENHYRTTTPTNVVLDYKDSANTDIDDMRFWRLEIETFIENNTKDANLGFQMRSTTKLKKPRSKSPSSKDETFEPTDEKSTKKKKVKKQVKNLWLTREEPVDDEFAQFLGQRVISRQEAYKRVWQYIKENQLQKGSDRRLIYCDDTLLKLLKPEVNPIPNMWTLNKLICEHFPKNTSQEEKPQTNPSYAPIIIQPNFAPMVVPNLNFRAFPPALQSKQSVIPKQE